MKKAVKLVVKGTVQGVFFRNFCKENANNLNLTGFVRNLDDGNVELVLEGKAANIGKMIELCRKGPEHSNIKNVEVEEKKWSGEFREFKVLRF